MSPEDAARLEAILAAPGVRAEPGPSEAGLAGLPADLEALHRRAGKVELEDGTVLLPGAEVPRATEWLKDARSLDWPPGIWVVGERGELVILRDVDPSGTRAGGGVLEAATDALSTFERVSGTLLGYLELRLGLPPGEAPSPEREAARAASRRDREALEAALSRPAYPGAEAALAHAWLVLGLLRAPSSPEAALEAFDRSAAARVAAARRGAERLAAQAAWRAASNAARAEGHPDLAEACLARLARA